MSVYIYPPQGATTVSIAPGADFATNTTLTATNVKLDTLHTDNGTTQTKIDTLHADNVAVENLITSSNTKLDTLHTDNGVIEGYIDGIETLVTSTNTKLDTLHTDLGTTIHNDLNTTIHTDLATTIHNDLVNLLTTTKPNYASAFLPVLLDFNTSAIVANAYTQVIASTGAKGIRFHFSNTSGSHIKIATGAALSEVVFEILPSGGSAELDIVINIATRISVTSDTAVTSGKFTISAFV